VTISLHEASVGVFVPYLGNLSGLLDKAAAHAETRNMDPAVLLNMRLSPTMYNLKQQVGEASRHAIVATALLAGCAPHTFSDAEPDIAELKTRISRAVDFVQALPRAAIDAAADKEVAFTFKNGSQRKFTGKSLLLTFSVPQFFFMSRRRTTSCAMPVSTSPRRTFWGRRRHRHQGKRKATLRCSPCWPRCVRPSRASIARSGGARRSRDCRPTGSRPHATSGQR
jgi:hypothetical protein